MNISRNFYKSIFSAQWYYLKSRKMSCFHVLLYACLSFKKPWLCQMVGNYGYKSNYVYRSGTGNVWRIWVLTLPNPPDGGRRHSEASNDDTRKGWPIFPRFLGGYKCNLYKVNNFIPTLKILKKPKLHHWNLCILAAEFQVCILEATGSHIWPPDWPLFVQGHKVNIHI